MLERRSQTGRVMYRSVIGGWNGSEEDKLRLQDQLELLQRDPAYLSYDTTLPQLNNELAPVSTRTLTHTHTTHSLTHTQSLTHLLTDTDPSGKGPQSFAVKPMKG